MQIVISSAILVVMTRRTSMAILKKIKRVPSLAKKFVLSITVFLSEIFQLFCIQNVWDNEFFAFLLLKMPFLLPQAKLAFEVFPLHMAARMWANFRYIVHVIAQHWASYIWNDISQITQTRI